jgi:hypothetical protein
MVTNDQHFGNTRAIMRYESGRKKVLAGCAADGLGNARRFELPLLVGARQPSPRPAALLEQVTRSPFGRTT